jgi:uncharacterized protein
MIKLKYFLQSPGLCGPASLKIVFDYYGVTVAEAKIAKIAGASSKKGSDIKGLIKAAKYFGFNAFYAKESSFEDIRHYIKKKIPVIVDWFLVDDGHYSVVVGIDEKNIVLIDPAIKKQRKMLLEDFYRVWFDFPGKFIRKPKDIILRSMLVVTPLKNNS